MISVQLPWWGGGGSGMEGRMKTGRRAGGKREMVGGKEREKRQEREGVGGREGDGDEGDVKRR